MTAKSRLDFNSLTLAHRTVTSPARSLLNLIASPVEFDSVPVSLSPFLKINSSLIAGGSLFNLAGAFAATCAMAAVPEKNVRRKATMNRWRGRMAEWDGLARSLSKVGMRFPFGDRRVVFAGFRGPSR